ncbi:MAG TPA: hypothetical protein VFV58_06955, partial [Blastocatellia bacterium]|nr:hypothetical protein [Blastocatellia bacterium]
MAEIPLTVQIKAVEREIAMRKAVYPKRVASKAMKQETADHEIAAMTAVLATLRRFESIEKALRFYGTPENWRFTHDKENNLLWVTSIGPNMAMDALNARV